MKTSKLETAIHEAYKKHFNHVQVKMMDLPKIYNEAKSTLLNNPMLSIDEIMPKLVQKYQFKG